MMFTASKGQPFAEKFEFKNSQGQPLVVPKGEFVLTLERGDLVRFPQLRLQRNAVIWNMTAEETAALEYSTMYFHLTFDGQEIARGILRVN
jgi:hypothetical protein